MVRFLPLLVGIAAVAAGAVDSGRQSGRWGKSEDLAVVAERVHRVSPEIGDWHSEPVALDSRQLDVAGVVSHESRMYTNHKTGAKVQMLLICGRPGPISVHEPTVCYAGAGYAQSGDLAKVAHDDDAFKSGRFVKGPPNADILRILWAWSTDGRWAAPDNPRRTFGRGTNALLKLYVIRQVGPSDADGSKDAADEFLDDLLPELKRCLSPTS
jgi:Protein of unknown function (DUF3485)